MKDYSVLCFLVSSHFPFLTLVHLLSTGHVHCKKETGVLKSQENLILIGANKTLGSTHVGLHNQPISVPLRRVLVHLSAALFCSDAHSLWSV